MCERNRIVITDLDGTLLDNSGHLSNYTIHTLRKLKLNTNFRVVFATGRHYSEVKDYIKMLGCNSVDYVISNDGQYLHDGLGNILWTNSKLDSDDVKEILGEIAFTKALVVTKNQDYLFVKSPVVFAFYCLVSIIRKSRWKPVLSNGKSDINEVIKIRIDRSAINDNVEKIFAEKYTVHSVLKNKVDITHKSTNKYFAIKQLLNILKISMNEAVYFGDDGNDIECFINLPQCIAMENAEASILNLSKEVALSNENNGVAKYLEENGWV